MATTTGTIKRLTDILDGVSSLVAAENARMSLEDEVDQATAKTIAGAEPNGGPRPAAGPTVAGPRPAGPGGTRPAGPGPARPMAPAPQGTQPSPAQSSPAPPSSAQSSPARAQEKPGQAPPRGAAADSDDKGDGVRVRPGSDNLGRPPRYR